MALLSTGQLARRTGISIRTLQRWAQQGLIRPAGKTPGGNLLWDVPDLLRQLAENIGPLPGEEEGRAHPQ